MLLSGMGELHLEIARDRLVNDFKAKATMGNIEISYRECVLAGTAPQRFVFDREVAGKKGKAACEAMIQPLEDNDLQTDFTVYRDGNSITLRIPSDEDGSVLPLKPIDAHDKSSSPTSQRSQML